MKRPFVNSHTLWRGLRLVLLVLVPLLILLKIKNRLTVMNTKKIDASLLTAALMDAGFKAATAKMITAQAAHETGNFTSTLYREFNNPFGMKQPQKRKTTSLGAWYGYATFPDIVQAANDFMYYWINQKLPQTFKNVSEYVDSLQKHGYFEALKSLYLSGVTHFYALYFS
jgi:hypothetical protein